MTTLILSAAAWTQLRGVARQALRPLVRRALQLARSVLSPSCYRHWIEPFAIRRRRARYDARTFFDSWYRATPQLSDAGTICVDAKPMPTRYHYNAMESTLIECLWPRSLPPCLTVLDVGSGAGHWIDFFREVVSAASVVGVEISESAASRLRQKYEGDGAVRILCADVARPDFALAQHFDLICAIGVMFHIVDDAAWLQAIRNLARCLKPEGLLLVGGQFGWLTRDVQFHNVDRFSTWDEFRQAQSDVALVNKRIRCLRRWRNAARQAGLQVLEVRRSRTSSRIATPENNLLVLRTR